MKKSVYYILLAVFACIFLFSAYKVGNYFWAKHESDQITQAAEKYVRIEEKDDEPELIEVDFDALHEMNRDIIAWIYCPDTQINYPVVQGSDNSYYLSHLLDGSYNVNGTIFMDYRGAADFSVANNILYGHHMKSGAMFADLIKYKESSFYNTHPVMYLFTPDRTFRLDLLAGLVVEADDPLYQLTELRAEQLQRYMSQSTFATKAETDGQYSVVTLSTCSYEYENARYVVLAQMVPIDK